MRRAGQQFEPRRLRHGTQAVRYVTAIRLRPYSSALAAISADVAARGSLPFGQ